MGKKHNKKDRLPYHIVKDSQNQIRLKMKETISGVTKRYGRIPKKMVSSGIIVTGILVVVLVALFVRGMNQSDLKESIDHQPQTNLIDVIVDEHNQLQAQVPATDDISLASGDLLETLQQSENSNEYEEMGEPAETTVKIIAEPQMAVGTQANVLNDSKNVKKLELIYPLRRQVGVITEYGWYYHPILEKWSYHQGVDLRCKKGDIAMTVAPGKVVEVTESFHEILLVTIDHGDEWTTVYGQLGQLTVQVGDSVVKGQQIGTIGQSETAIEPHLHFEIRHNGETLDPVSFL